MFSLERISARDCQSLSDSFAHTLKNLFSDIRCDIAKILMHLIIFHLDQDIENRLKYFPVDLSEVYIDK